MKLDGLTGHEIGAALDRLEAVGFVRPATTKQPKDLLAGWRDVLTRIRCTPAELEDAITAFMAADRPGYWPKPGVIVEHVLAARRAAVGSQGYPVQDFTPAPMVPVVVRELADGPVTVLMPAEDPRRAGRPLASEVTCPDPDCQCLAFEVWVPLGGPVTERPRSAGSQEVVPIGGVRPRRVPSMIAWRWGHVVARHGYALVSGDRIRIREATA